MYESRDECEDCPQGYFCDGSGQRKSCPSNSTTTSARSSTSEDCECKAGHEPSAFEGCAPCQPGRYKSGVSNTVCSLTCPANANSPPGATELSHCFCNEGFHAQLAEGKLDRCAPCTYPGLSCPGGFKNGSHAQPRASKGWYKTGETVAVQCSVLDAAGSSVCLGGENSSCSEGADGWLCGECPSGWARARYLQACEACEASGAGHLALAVLTDLARITSLNFGVAVLSALGAGKRKLHPAMIRMAQRWKDACSVLLRLSTLQPSLDRPEAKGGSWELSAVQ